jgi:hypothetical protein
MGMDILLNERIYIPTLYSKGEVKVSIEVEGYTLPEFDHDKIHTIVLRLGDFRGYELAEFLACYTNDDGFIADTWRFGQSTADELISAISRVVDEGEEAYGCPKEDDNYEYFIEDIKEIREIFKSALERGASDFEFVTWY